jgi:Fur family ferric uptake transcriptional regulator
MESKIFQNFLVEKGLKLTRERMAVMNEIFAFHGHFGPEHLYMRIRGSGIKASRASVYRTLNLLVESGLVERISRTDKGSVYEHTFGHKHHDHMICTACGEIIEFFSERLEDVQNMICTEHDFNGTSHSLEIRGVCGRCRTGKR